MALCSGDKLWSRGIEGPLRPELLWGPLTSTTPFFLYPSIPRNHKHPLQVQTGYTHQFPSLCKDIEALDSFTDLNKALLLMPHCGDHFNSLRNSTPLTFYLGSSCVAGSFQVAGCDFNWNLSETCALRWVLGNLSAHTFRFCDLWPFTEFPVDADAGLCFRPRCFSWQSGFYESHWPCSSLWSLSPCHPFNRQNPASIQLVKRATSMFWTKIGSAILRQTSALVSVANWGLCSHHCVPACLYHSGFTPVSSHESTSLHTCASEGQLTFKLFSVRACTRLCTCAW